MQVTIQPLIPSHGAAVHLDANPQGTVATLISTFCTQKGIHFDSNLVIFDEKRRPLPQFSTLSSLGITQGQSLLIGYPDRSFAVSEKWPFIVAVGALIIGLVGIVTISMVYGLTGGVFPDDYGVVMDAGSSKTNNILYSWQSSKHKGTGCVSQIDKCSAGGGIAKMDPMKLDTVIECTENVTRRINNETIPKTPLYFAATAGMRLLNLTNPARAEHILEQLHFDLNRTGLSVRNIEIISGRDEGIYGWIAANFLEQTLEAPQKINPWDPTTFGALDMGGASLQISYALPEENENDTSIVSLQLYGQTHNVLSVSNLCFGRDEAERRYRYLLVKNPTITEILDPCLPKGYILNMTGADLFGLPCTKNKKVGDVLAKDNSIAGQIYQFIGTSSPAFCAGNVSKLLDAKLCNDYKFEKCFQKMDNIPDKQLYLAFATYFFTTNFLNVTDSTLEEYEQATEKFCAKDVEEVKKISDSKYATEYCFNGNYIHETLINGFNFDSSKWKNLRFVSNIAGKDVGWTLGYMINATNLIPAKAPTPRLISAAALTLSLIIFIVVIFATIIFVYNHHRSASNTSEKLSI